MRFIQLTMDKEESTHYDTIIQFGCGPNFVLNRPHLFETMLNDQGLKFWFRFWLTFCLQPRCYDLCMIQRNWPRLTAFILGDIHTRFLQGTIQNRSRYCLDRVIRPMHVKSRNKSLSKEKMKDYKLQLQELVSKCLGFAFGCALCDVFFKWLSASDINDDNQTYWTIPKNFLQPNFKPKLLERFLIDTWKEELISLLGVTEDQASWITNLVKNEEVKIDLRKHMNDEIQEFDDRDLIRQTSNFMREIRNGRKKHIQDIDEDKLTRCVGNKPKLRFASSIHTGINRSRQCNYCSAFENENKKLKKCKRCVENSWLEPRYYCSVTCQVVDWYRLHHLEHRAELSTAQSNVQKRKDNSDNP